MSKETTVTSIYNTLVNLDNSRTLEWVPKGEESLPYGIKGSPLRQKDESFISLELIESASPLEHLEELIMAADKHDCHVAGGESFPTYEVVYDQDFNLSRLKGADFQKAKGDLRNHPTTRCGIFAKDIVGESGSVDIAFNERVLKVNDGLGASVVDTYLNLVKAKVVNAQIERSAETQ